MIERPEKEEYAAYYQHYVDLASSGDLMGQLVRQQQEMSELLGALPESKGHYRYADGKWTLNELLGHIIDNERVMSYRLLVIARGDQTSLPPYDQDLFVANGEQDTLLLANLLEEYESVRLSTLTLMRSLSSSAWNRVGVVNQHPQSARAVAHIIAGHELHHIHILKERYLG